MADNADNIRHVFCYFFGNRIQNILATGTDLVLIEVKENKIHCIFGLHRLRGRYIRDNRLHKLRLGGWFRSRGNHTFESGNRIQIFCLTVNDIVILPVFFLLFDPAVKSGLCDSGLLWSNVTGAEIESNDQATAGRGQLFHMGGKQVPVTNRLGHNNIAVCSSQTFTGEMERIGIVEHAIQFVIGEFTVFRSQMLGEWAADGLCFVQGLDFTV